MDLKTWIADYQAYLKSHGYATRTLGFRLKYLSCLERFVKTQGLKSLEEFKPEHAADFVAYWVGHQPWAKNSRGFRRKYRFQPSHHIALQCSLHCFFRWAHSTGRLRRNIFPLQPPVRGRYFFPHRGHGEGPRAGRRNSSLFDHEAFVGGKHDGVFTSTGLPQHRARDNDGVACRRRIRG